MNAIERLAALLTEASAMPWRLSDEGEILGFEASDGFREVVAEQVDTSDAALVVATVNALPALLAAVRALAAEGCADSGNTHERCWDMDAEAWPRDVWCSRCKALAPLLMEASDAE